MLANADLLDEFDDYDDENHINQGGNDGFNDYKLSSKNSFGGQSDLVAFGNKSGNSQQYQPYLASSNKKNARPVKRDAEDDFLDDIINRHGNVGNGKKAPPAVNF